MKFLLVNKQMELMFGYARSALLGSNFDILLPQEIRHRYAILFDGYFLAPSVRPMNMARPLKTLRRDGKEIEVQINLSPIVSEQGVLGLASLRNVV
jgi:PAS domain S-box-containing protein